MSPFQLQAAALSCRRIVFSALPVYRLSFHILTSADLPVPLYFHRVRVFSNRVYPIFSMVNIPIYTVLYSDSQIGEIHMTALWLKITFQSLTVLVLSEHQIDR